TFNQVPPPTQTLGGRHLGVQRVTLPSPSRKNDGGSECPLLPRLSDRFDRLELVGAGFQDHASSPSSCSWSGPGDTETTRARGSGQRAGRWRPEAPPSVGSSGPVSECEYS